MKKYKRQLLVTGLSQLSHEGSKEIQYEIPEHKDETY